MTEGYKTRHELIDELIPDDDIVTAGTLADGIGTGDYVDFGPYGTLYIVERYDDNTALVNGSKKAIRNPKPIGWVIDLRLAERIVAKYVWEEDFPNAELNDEITKTCPECGSSDVDRGPHGYVCRNCGAPMGWTEGKIAQKEQEPYTTSQLSVGDRLETTEGYSVYPAGMLGTVEAIDDSGKAKIKLDTPVPNPFTNDPDYVLVGSNGLRSWKFSS